MIRKKDRTRPTIFTEGKAKCVFEPRGRNGLEGYDQDDIYRFQRCSNGENYIRVFPGSAHPEWDVSEGKYYETCGPNEFLKFFEIIEEKYVE